jgi:hypothetical protein
MSAVRVTASSGAIKVTAEERDDVAVDQGQRHPLGGVLEIKGASNGVAMRVPIGTDLVVGASSGSITLVGDLGEVRATTRSGRIRVESATSLDVRTMSGSVEIGTVTGTARIKTASGRVSLESVDGDLNVASVSGRVTVVDANGEVHINTVNGTVDVGMTRAADARADSVSGAVTIGLPAGVHPAPSLVSVSGRCECKVPSGDDCCVTGRTVSGHITVRERR